MPAPDSVGTGHPRRNPGGQRGRMDGGVDDPEEVPIATARPLALHPPIRPSPSPPLRGRHDPASAVWFRHDDVPDVRGDRVERLGAGAARDAAVRAARRPAPADREEARTRRGQDQRPRRTDRARGDARRGRHPRGAGGGPRDAARAGRTRPPAVPVRRRLLDLRRRLPGRGLRRRAARDGRGGAAVDRPRGHPLRAHVGRRPGLDPAHARGAVVRGRFLFDGDAMRGYRLEAGPGAFTTRG